MESISTTSTTPRTTKYKSTLTSTGDNSKSANASSSEASSVLQPPQHSTAHAMEAPMHQPPPPEMTLDSNSNNHNNNNNNHNNNHNHNHNNNNNNNNIIINNNNSRTSLFQENQAYEYSAQHRSLLWQEKAPPPSLRNTSSLGAAAAATVGRAGATASSSSSSTDQSQIRSTPITIVRPLTAEKGMPGSTAGFETDEEEDDDDDDENHGRVIDVVERDAIRLRRKYGDNVVATTTAGATSCSYSYDPGRTSMDDTTTASILAKTMLKAPYLGSLSKSENFLFDLPPMSLTDNEMSCMEEEEEEPQPELLTTSYGSLRESHQRGKFLDGPSSYREPRSGQIRRLEQHRVQNQAGGVRLLSSSQPQPLSIGERMQQAQKLRQTRQVVKEKRNATEGDTTTTGASSLSAMMQGVSKKSEESSPEPQEFLLPVATGAPYEQDAFGADNDDEGYDKFDPPNMMSTSLTAFEILNSSSKLTAGYQHNHNHNHTHRFVQQQQQNTAAAAAAAVYMVGPPSAPISSSVLPSEAEIREQRFQPLSRSLSDPTPHHSYRSPLLAPTLQPLNSPQSTLAPGNVGNAWVPASSIGISNMMDPSTATIEGVAADSAMYPAMYGYAAAPLAQTSTDHATGTASGTAPGPPAHNPDTDAAFDMDME